MPKYLGVSMKEWIPIIISVVSLIGIIWSVYVNLKVDGVKLEMGGKIELITNTRESDMKSVFDRFEITKDGVNRRFVAVERAVEVVEKSQKNIHAIFSKKFDDASERSVKHQEQLYETQKAILELRTPIRVIESRLREFSKD